MFANVDMLRLELEAPLGVEAGDTPVGRDQAHADDIAARARNSAGLHGDVSDWPAHAFERGTEIVRPHNIQPKRHELSLLFSFL